MFVQKSLAVVTNFLKRLSIFEGRITGHDMLNCLGQGHGQILPPHSRHPLSLKQKCFSSTSHLRVGRGDSAKTQKCRRADLCTAAPISDLAPQAWVAERKPEAR